MNKPTILLGLLTLFTTSGFAAYPNQGNSPIQAPAPAPDEVHFTVDQTFQSTFRRRHGYDPDYQYNNVTNTWHYDFNALRRFSLGDSWSLNAGVDTQRYDFGDNRSKAPNLLQSYATRIVLEQTQNGQPAFRLITTPGLYFSHRLDVRDFDAPTLAEWFYPVSQDVSLMGGARLSMQSNTPVLPLAGVLWRINPDWDLQGCLPNPRLVYHYSETTQLWGGGEITGGSFRYDDQGKVDYYEVRTGAGAKFQFNNVLSASFEMGAALVRNWRLRHYTAETKPTPYVRLIFGAAF